MTAIYTVSQTTDYITYKGRIATSTTNKQDQYCK